MNLSIQSLTMCFLFFIFYPKKKPFQKLRKIVNSSNKHFSFLRYSVFLLLFFLGVFFLFFPVSRFNWPDQKSNFCKHVLQLKDTSKRLQVFFVFHNLVHKKGPGAKGKNQVTFFTVSFKITYFQKSCIAWFGLITKIKKGCGTSFYCRFCAYLFHKNILY